MAIYSSKYLGRTPQIAIMKYLLLVSVIFVLQSCLSASTLHKSARTYDWNGGFNSFKYEIDSATSTYPLLLYPSYKIKENMGVTIPFYNSNKEQVTVEVRMKYKMENCHEMSLQLKAIGECGKVTSVDTLQIPMSGEWTVFNKSIKMATSPLLGLILEAKGEEKPKEVNLWVDSLSFSANQERVVKYSKIWIDNLDILIDGKHTDELLSFNKNANVIIKKSDIIPIVHNDFSNLPFINEKILAIGESIHGTETMNDMAIQIIKNRIEHEKCRLVLLELPLTVSFHINRYLDGDERFALDSIASYFDNILFSSPSFTSLLQWIKEYNLHSVEKVHFFGIDWNTFQLQSKIDLYNFFYTLNESGNSKELEKMCDSLLKQDKEFPLKKAFSVFTINHGFADILNPQEAEIMKYCLTAEDKVYDEWVRMLRRDSIMFENAKFLMNVFCKKDDSVTIYCHLGHTNYTGISMWHNSNAHPFGEYMRSYYKKYYCCVGLVAEHGKYLSFISPGRQGIGQLQVSPTTSLEYLINHLDVSLCYLPLKNMPDINDMKIRYLGNRVNNAEQFKWGFPKCMMDGVIFIKDVSALNKSEEIFNSNLDLHVRAMQSLMYIYEKKRNRTTN